MSVLIERSLPHDADAEVAALMSRQHGTVSLDQATAVGLTKGQVRVRLDRKRWERIHPAVYRVAGVPRTWRQSVMAACLAHRPPVAAGRRAAAALWQLRGFEGKQPVEVAVERGRRKRLRGVIVYETTLEPADVVILDGIPTTTVARTLIDLPPVAPFIVVEIAFDGAASREMITTTRLRKRLDQLSESGKRQAVAKLHALIDERDRVGIPKSPLETLSLRLIIDSGLPPPVCQYQIPGAEGPLHVDFAYPDDRLALEAESYEWHSDPRAFARDLARRNKLMALGWRIIHLTADDVKLRRAETVARIADALGIEVPRLAGRSR